ncbi:ethanolamine utilization protein EutH, partial [Faecalitalea cylindroides]
MNPFVCIMLIFATIGLIDKILDNKFGLASAFDKGIITMGDFML